MQVVATDLDGTLLRSDGAVSARTRAALHAVQREGRWVVLATGRPIRFVHRLAADLGGQGPVICANGAVVYDAARDRVVEERALRPTTTREVIAALRAQEPDLAFAWETTREFRCEPGFAALAEWPVPDGAVLDESVRDTHDGVVKLLARHPAGDMSSMFDGLAAQVDGLATVTHSTATLVEVSAAGVDKGTAVAQFVAERGFAPEHTIAFGDMPNDLALLDWAGWSVAVANAHPLVRARADTMTASNDEDGVALVLEGLPRGP
ncbi:HAD family hydrolase [Egibacter rhizosphaerae]|uniref:HAD family hydrolase n=1 Tax=Egibacter rhizosphaerae TaxID=1670831 RepID=UPI0013F1662E|nr:HAD family hydrolase [Egibacter rhizosphaerae]